MYTCRSELFIQYIGLQLVTHKSQLDPGVSTKYIATNFTKDVNIIL